MYPLCIPGSQNLYHPYVLESYLSLNFAELLTLLCLHMAFSLIGYQYCSIEIIIYGF